MYLNGDISFGDLPHIEANRWNHIFVVLSGLQVYETKLWIYTSRCLNQTSTVVQSSRIDTSKWKQYLPRLRWQKSFFRSIEDQLKLTPSLPSRRDFLSSPRNAEKPKTFLTLWSYIDKNSFWQQSLYGHVIDPGGGGQHKLGPSTNRDFIPG